MLNIKSVLRIESRTTPANFDNKSASFYCELDDLAYIIDQKEVLIAHFNNETEEVRYVVVSGMRLFSQLQTRKLKGKTYCIYRYE